MIRKIYLISFLMLAIAAILPAAAEAQRTSRIYRPCAGSSTPAKVEVNASGDLVFTPCSAREILLSPTFGASATKESKIVIDDQTAFSTALDYSPLYINANANLTGSAKAVRGLDVTVTQAGSGSNPQAYGASFSVTNSATTPLMYGVSSTLSPAAASTQGRNLNLSLTATATVTTLHGIYNQVGTGTNGAVTNMSAGTFGISNAAGGTITTAKGIALENWGGSATTSYGIYANSSIDTGATRYFIYSLSTSPSFFTGKITYDATNTAGGTTGNQTINKPSGTVNVAAGAGAAGLTVTNSYAAATSIVYAIARTNDATCAVKNVVPAAGSFVITMTANCTAETSVGFIVNN